MAVKPEEVVEYLGYTSEQLDGFENIDALKADVDKEFIRRSVAAKDKDFKKAVSGELLGSLTTKIKAAAKTYGVEFSADEIKDVTPEKLAELSLSKLSTASTTALEEVKKQIGKPDEALTELQTKYTTLEKKYKDTEGLLKTTTEDFTGYKEKTATEIKNAKINFERNQLLSGITPRPDVSELDKIGFKAAVNDRLVFEYDENNVLVVKNKEGHYIPNKNKAGEFLNPEQALKSLADELKYTAANQHSKEVKKPFINNQQQNKNEQQNTNTPVRKINSYRPALSVGK